MKKKMYEIALYIKDAEVVIEQSNPFESSDVIYLTSEQIDLLIKWLLAAKKELRIQE